MLNKPGCCGCFPSHDAFNDCGAKAWKLARSNLLTCLLLFRWNSRGIHLGKSAGFHRVWERPQSHMCGEAGHYQTCFYHLAPRHQGNLLQQMGLVNDIYQSAFTYTTTICFRQSTTLVQEAGYRWKPILLGTLQPLTSLSTQWLHPTRANTVAIRQMPKKLVWMFKYKKVRIPSSFPLLTLKILASQNTYKTDLCDCFSIVSVDVLWKAHTAVFVSSPKKSFMLACKTNRNRKHF